MIARYDGADHAAKGEFESLWCERGEQALT